MPLPRKRTVVNSAGTTFNTGIFIHKSFTRRNMLRALLRTTEKELFNRANKLYIAKYDIYNVSIGELKTNVIPFVCFLFYNNNFKFT